VTIRREITVRGRGPDEPRVTFYVEAYRGQVWSSAYDCPFTCVAILEPAQADHLVDLINQATQETRAQRNGQSS
jgi:hypothetical protein